MKKLAAVILSISAIYFFSLAITGVETVKSKWAEEFSNYDGSYEHLKDTARNLGLSLEEEKRLSSGERVGYAIVGLVLIVIAFVIWPAPLLSKKFQVGIEEFKKGFREGSSDKVAMPIKGTVDKTQNGTGKEELYKKQTPPPLPPKKGPPPLPKDRGV